MLQSNVLILCYKVMYSFYATKQCTHSMLQSNVQHVVCESFKKGGGGVNEIFYRVYFFQDTLTTMSNNEIFLQDFPGILKRTLQNY